MYNTFTQVSLLAIFVIVNLLVLVKKISYKPTKVAFGFFVILLILVVIARPSTMADYYFYDAFFASSGESRFEFGFHVIRKIAQITNNPVIVGLGIAAICAVVLRCLYIYKYSKWILGSILVYMSYVYILQDMITIRAGIASACLPFIILAKQQNKYMKMCILLIVAILFHQSAAIFLPIVVLNERKHEQIFYPLILIGSYLLAMKGLQLGKFIALLQIASVQEHFSTFDSSEANIFNLLQMGRVCVCLCGWLCYKRYKNIGENYIEVLMLKLYTIGLCVVVLLSDFLIIAYRFGEILLSVEVIVVPYVVMSLFKNNTFRKVAICVYSIIMFYIMYSDQALWIADY